MVKHQEASLSRVFRALSDPTRRAILTRLADGEASVGELASPFDMSMPAISKHLAVLERAELLHRTKDGRVHRIGLAPEPLKRATEWLAFYRQFWDTQFDALAGLSENRRKRQPR